ncbi:MAG: ABC transporter permease subunit [Oscillospiraceae bacterium]|jgi:putative aldouronate transport system permease protein|nr:ABC transporter permease subunit [Oscillospiraceae bacterium]
MITRVNGGGAAPTIGAAAREDRFRAALRIAAAALCLVLIASLFMQYVTATDQRSDEPLAFTGVMLLRGATGGRSEGAPHPMLIAALIAAALLLAYSSFNVKSAFMPIFASAAGLAALLLLRFDVVFSERREFNFAAGSAVISAGWNVGAASMAAVLAAAITFSVRSAYLKRREAYAAVFDNRSLPANYTPPTTGEIIIRDMRKHWPVYLMILPTLVYYVVWAYGPMQGIVIAFNDYAPKKGFWGSNWAGLKWFREFFRSPFALRTIRNTLMINILNLLIGFPAPILLALMLNELTSTGYKRAVQTVTYIPHFISLVVLCGLLIDFVSSDGAVTSFLKLFGFPSVNLLGQARYFRSVYIVSDLWQHLGWNSIIYLSALASIQMELYEAARIDGAGKLKQVWHVTLPGIAPTITILLILQIGSMMSVGYEKIILLYNSITYETADVVSSYVYRVGIEDADFSRSTAVNLFNSLINFSLVVSANRLSRAMSETSLW